MLWSGVKVSPVDDTEEETHAQFEFHSNEPLGFCDQTYLDAMWNVISSYAPPGMAPSVNDLTTLDFYRKNGKGWFDADTAKTYGYEIYGQMSYIEQEMNRDVKTRRAVIRFPQDCDSCLLSIQFTFRTVVEEEGLIPLFTTTANFRSSDAIYGLPADFWLLFKLTDSLMPPAQVALPHYTNRIVINAESFHIYDKDAHLLLGDLP